MCLNKQTHFPSRNLLLLAVCLTLFSSPLYAELKTGMAADVVIGQPDFTQSAEDNGGTGANTIDNPGGPFVSGTRVFVPDFDNKRVLIWNSIPSTNNARADIVLGQPNFVTTTDDDGNEAANTLDGPNTVYSDGQRLIVADFSNNRVLIWSSVPSTNQAPADVVVGQASFAGTAANQGGNRAANTLSGMFSAVSDGRRLYVADSGNNRVLIWNTIPTTNNAPADVVLGQPDFTSNTANNGGIGARTLNSPRGISTDGKRLFVIDASNNRVLIWNQIPTENQTAADIVLGQRDFKSSSANAGGVGANTLNAPTVGIHSDGKRLYVADRFNHRVLIWYSIPTKNNASADVVLGQPNFTSNSADNGGVTAKSMERPYGLYTNGPNLIVSDGSNHRILIYNIGQSAIDLSPQFEQGKAVLGKVFWDWNGNGVQDSQGNSSPLVGEDETQGEKVGGVPLMTPHPNLPPQRGEGKTMNESGIEGVRVVSDTGIYAITDHDGKYHYPFIETGQRLLKIDPSTLPEGAIITTESPRKVTVTEGILTKVSFGVKPTEGQGSRKECGVQNAECGMENPEHGITTGNYSAFPTPHSAFSPDPGPLLQVSISQDPTKLKPHLSITAEEKEDHLLFTIDCNYFLFIKKSHISLYDENLSIIKTISLPQPLPYHYELPLKDLLHHHDLLHYQLSVFDSQGREDRTSVGKLSVHSS